MPQPRKLPSSLETDPIKINELLVGLPDVTVLGAVRHLDDSVELHRLAHTPVDVHKCIPDPTNSDVPRPSHNPKVVSSLLILHDPFGMHAVEVASFSTLHRWGGNRLAQSRSGWRFIPE
jgi:hypothetical protein